MKRENDIQRVEAFSDGIFAIASTLLILEIKVPDIRDFSNRNALLQSILEQWPSFMAFFISFATILGLWVNHHHFFKLLAKTSKAFLFTNGFLLLTITFLPYPTAILARYINTPMANTAVMFYSFSYLLMNLAFNVWWFSLQRPVYLLSPEMSKSNIRKLTIECVSSFFVYIFITIIAWWFPVVALIIIAAVLVLWRVFTISRK